MTDPRPSRRCDLVMKGGITSGVVYPLAVCELAKSFRFASIGGTSAGAIAAAFTAAAEARRRRGDEGGYEELARLPEWLGGRDGRQTRLLALFSPDPISRRVHSVAVAPFTRGSGFRRVGRTLRAVALGYPMALLAGAAPGLMLLALAFTGSGLLALWAGLWGLFTAFLGSAAGGTWALTCDARRALTANGFGLCTGMGSRSSSTQALSTWLVDRLDALAGSKTTDRPLTFGDLGSSSEGDPIHLEMVTTCLTQGRPVSLPFENETFFFDPAEMRRYLPERVVRHMEQHGRPPSSARERREWEQAAPLRPLPAGADLPVALAVRLSLSFPLLVSAVPLYAVDRSRRRARRPDGSREPVSFERCWFSDGGICSNFPVHFFDEPLPRWPTFGINLREFHPDFPPADEESKNVWIPRSNRAGLQALWDRFDRKEGTSSLMGFVGAIVRTMQGWTDNTQIGVPGYRDRVVHVPHSDEEGGLNLDMEPATIERLARRGEAAGRVLRRRFALGGDGSGLDWDSHRWVRLRTTLALLVSSLQRLRGAWESGGTNDSSTMTYAELLDRPSGSEPRGYPFVRAGQRDLAREVATDVLEGCDRWESAAENLAEGAPRPSPELRIRPRAG